MTCLRCKLPVFDEADPAYVLPAYCVCAATSSPSIPLDERLARARQLDAEHAKRAIWRSRANRTVITYVQRAERPCTPRDMAEAEMDTPMCPDENPGGLE